LNVTVFVDIAKFEIREFDLIVEGEAALIPGDEALVRVRNLLVEHLPELTHYLLLLTFTGVILQFMSTIVEVERLALDLSEKERATLAANLLDSLPGILSDDDEGITEALRRDAEVEADPAQTISLAELDSQIQGRRR